MIYATNNEGIEAMKAAASHIQSGLEELETICQKMDSLADANEGIANIDSLRNAAGNIKQSIKEASEPAENVITRLNGLADAYTEAIEEDQIGNLGK